MFQKALVPIDGSEIAEAAIDYLLKAVGPETKVVLLQVVDSAERIVMQTTPAGFGIASASYSADLVTSVIEAQRTAASRHLEDTRARLTAAGLKDVETLILDGLPGEEIVRVATEQNFDLVAMGTHGRSGLSRTVLGSVADHVVRNLDGIPVLLVHPPEA